MDEDDDGLLNELLEDYDNIGMEDEDEDEYEEEPKSRK